MENNNKIELSTAQMVMIILCTGIISIVLFFSGFFIINTLKKNNTEVAKVNENTTLEKLKVDKLRNIADILPTPTNKPTPIPTPTPTPTPTSTPYSNSDNDYIPTQYNPPEGFKETLLSSERFTISKIEEDSDGYTLYVHILENSAKVVYKEVWDNLLNGGKIKFRGVNWVNSGRIETFGDNTVMYLKEENKDITDRRIITIENTKDVEYIFKDGWLEGKPVSDYRTEEIAKIRIDKNVKLGDRFDHFLYNEDTNQFIVTGPSYQIHSNDYSEDSVRDVLKWLEENSDDIHVGNECKAYFLNGKVVAIQVFTASSP